MKANNLFKLLIAILVVAIVGGAVFYFNYTNRFIYNNDTAKGNTTGNLNNGGKFCEYDDKIYFSNPYDKGYLYVMNSDCSDARLLKDSSVEYINVCGKYIYYADNGGLRKYVNEATRGNSYGIYRINLDGSGVEKLHSNLSGVSSLCGNYIYYQRYDNKTPLCFYRTKIDASSEEMLSETPHNPASINNGKVYYTDVSNKNNIMCYNPESQTTGIFYNANAYLVDVTDNYIYYIDLDKNYSLVRLNLNNKTLELLYEASDNGKVINYNRYGNKIFFQVEGTENGLYRMNINGTQIEKIATGNLRNIYCTSQYTFFQYFEDSTTLYRVPTSGTLVKVEQITIEQQK